MDEQSWVISRVQCDEVENNTCKVKTERDCLKLKIESQAKRIAELEKVVDAARALSRWRNSTGMYPNPHELKIINAVATFDAQEGSV